MPMRKALLFAAAIVALASPTLAQQHDHSSPPAALAQNSPPPQGVPASQNAPSPGVASPGVASPGAAATGDMHAPTSFTLRSGIAEGRMVYIGVGGDIEGKVNPLLMVHEGETVQINLINGEGAEHDIVVEQYAARSDRVVGRGASSTMSFTADKSGEFIYFCSIPGHREAGM